MSTLEIVVWIVGCLALAVWCIGGGVWFASLFSYAGPNDDFPRGTPWQIFLGGPLIWLLLLTAWRKARAAEENAKTKTCRR